MAEAAVQPQRHAHRFFCHRCNVEFEDNLQDFTCPYCSTGFIEYLDHDRDAESLVSGTTEDEEYSDADMSNLEDANNVEESVEGSADDLSRQSRRERPMLNDLAFLMTGGRLRPIGRRTESLMEQLAWMIGGRGGPGAVTAGSPFVFIGAPGDYVFGGEGLDAVVTQLLGQLENTGPPPLPREQINAIPNDKITAAQVEANMSCSVCWDNFTLEETVSRLECEHIFHPGCITPWLQLHATCPVCRRSLLAARPAPPADLTPASSSTTTQTDTDTPSYSRVVVRRVPRRRRDAEGSSSGSSVSPGGLWAQLASSIASAASAASATPATSATSATSPASPASPASSPSAASLASSDRDAQYMDIDYD